MEVDSRWGSKVGQSEQTREKAEEGGLAGARYHVLDTAGMHGNSVAPAVSYKLNNSGHNTSLFFAV